MLTPKDLFKWQQKSAALLATRKQCALFADPGDGKTITTLTAIALLKPKRTLIVAPSKVCSEQVWPDELANWTHTYKASIATMQGLTPAKRLKVLFDSSRFHVINYELLVWLIDTLKKRKTSLAKHYQAVVFDELSNLKTPSSKRFKKLRYAVKKVPIRFGLTGSPTGNNILNLWPEMFAVASDRPLGDSVVAFREKYFDSDYSGFNWEPKEDAEDKILDLIKPYATYSNNARGTDKEDRISYKPIYHGLPAKLQDTYAQLKKEFVALGVSPEGDDLYASTAGVLTQKLKQFEAGGIYKNVELGEEPTGEWINLHSERIDRTVELVEALNGQQLLLFYEYEHELLRLKHALPGAIHINSKNAVARWNNKSIQILLAHPKSAGHGLNLHKSGAYNMLFFNSPWSWELTEQCIGRLDRTGQKKRVNVYHFRGLYISDRVVDRWKVHEELQNRVKQAVAA